MERPTPDSDRSKNLWLQTCGYEALEEHAALPDAVLTSNLAASHVVLRAWWIVSERCKRVGAPLTHCRSLRHAEWRLVARQIGTEDRGHVEAEEAVLLLYRQRGQLNLIRLACG